MLETAGTPRSESSIAVHCPADRRVIADVPDMGASTVEESSRLLRDAQPPWEASGAAGRAAWVGRFRDWIVDNEDRLVELLRQETGKPWHEASLEITASLDILNYYAERTERFLADRTPRPHSLMGATKRLRVVHRPYPVVGVITPWNFPIAVPMLDVIPALMAGCAVLTKPSEITPLAWREMVRGWSEDVGAPPVLACVTGASAAAPQSWTTSISSSSRARRRPAGASRSGRRSGSSRAALSSAARTP
jgi:acyl-CoA reductase-like NAD-dependent aldehyde dehydrogenase